MNTLTLIGTDDGIRRWSRQKQYWKRCEAFLMVVGVSVISSFEVIVTVIPSRYQWHPFRKTVDTDINCAESSMTTSTTCRDQSNQGLFMILCESHHWITLLIDYRKLALIFVATWGWKSAPALGCDRTEASSTEFILMVKKGGSA